MELPPVAIPPVAVAAARPAPPVADPLDAAPVVQPGLAKSLVSQALASPPAPATADCDPPLPPVEEASPPLQSTGLLAANIALLSHVLECPPVPACRITRCPEVRSFVEDITTCGVEGY